LLHLTHNARSDARDRKVEAHSNAPLRAANYSTKRLTVH
jgi:hypothetical protein